MSNRKRRRYNPNHSLKQKSKQREDPEVTKRKSIWMSRLIDLVVAISAPENAMGMDLDDLRSQEGVDETTVRNLIQSKHLKVEDDGWVHLNWMKIQEEVLSGG